MCNCELCKMAKRLQEDRPNWSETTHKIINDLWGNWVHSDMLLYDKKDREKCLAFDPAI